MSTINAIIVVDVQNDFCEGGALPVPNSASLINPLNSFIKRAEAKGFLIIFTRDWHPADHKSFKKFDGKWPVHCVKDSKGAQFHPNLYFPKSSIIISKGQDNTTNGYSAFENNRLSVELNNNSNEQILIAGLATDYCVKETSLGALRNGYKSVIILEDLCRSITDKPEIIINELKQRGASIKNSAGFFSSRGFKDCFLDHFCDSNMIESNN